MKPEVVIALVLAAPIILFPAAFTWYLTLGGVHAAIREAKKGLRKTTGTRPLEA